MIKGSVIALFILLSANSLFSQAETEVKLSKPGFKSLQLDFTTLLFVNTLGASMDVDLLVDKKNKMASGGFRIGADYFMKGSPGGPESGSPYFDLNAYARGTLDTKFIRTDFYAGPTYHWESEEGRPYGFYTTKNGLYLKFGGELKVKLYKNYIGLMGKFAISSPESYGGFGIFIGYGE